MWSSFHPHFGLSAIAKQGCVTASRSLNELLVKGNEGLAPSTLRHLFTETDAERVPGDLMLEGEAEGDLSFRKANVQGDYSFVTLILVIPVHRALKAKPRAHLRGFKVMHWLVLFRRP